jgi:hypothetical protein
MMPFLILIAFLGFFIFLFFKEVRRERVAFLELDRKNDAYMLREIETYLKAQAAKKDLTV